jgi:hypothetical protein
MPRRVPGRLRPFPLAVSLALAAAPAAAQNLSLDRAGGALGGVTSFPLRGLPQEPYYLLFDVLEQQTPLPAPRRSSRGSRSRRRGSSA